MAKVNGLVKADLSDIFSLEMVRSLFRGVGQVMFQGNGWTGALFLIGIFWGSYASDAGYVAWGALLGVVVSTLTGFILGLPKSQGFQGLWGFNGVLVGCAFPTFMGATPLMWIALVLCAAMTTWVRVALNNVMKPWKVNSFTFPFVLCTWIFLLAAHVMGGLPPTHMDTPAFPSEMPSHVTPGLWPMVKYWLRGISQVFLIDSWVAGLLMVLGLLVSNRWAALWAVVGSAVALSVALLYRAPGMDVEGGLYGFSSVLTGIALGATFYHVNLRSALWALLGVIVTVFFQAAIDVLLTPLGVAALTSPFCIVTWLFLLPLFKFNQSKEEDEDHSSWRNLNARQRRVESSTPQPTPQPTPQHEVPKSSINTSSESFGK
ncbi:MAG: urea transporter [Rikenellaceae bacterium]|nr:urea transporter [Rikenellaceae bacterium]